MSQEQRQAVIAEARKWIGTPYHLNAQIVGVGVDCGTFLTAVFEGAGLIERPDLGTFTPDFNLHRGDEVYLGWLRKYCRQVTTARPGDIVVYRFGRIFAHGALVLDWPQIIHCYTGRGVILADATDATLAPRQGSIWSFWGEGP